MLSLGLFVRLEAKPGKEDEVAAFLMQVFMGASVAGPPRERARDTAARRHAFLDGRRMPFAKLDVRRLRFALGSKEPTLCMQSLAASVRKNK